MDPLTPDPQPQTSPETPAQTQPSSGTEGAPADISAAGSDPAIDAAPEAAQQAADSAPEAPAVETPAAPIQAAPAAPVAPQAPADDLDALVARYTAQTAAEEPPAEAARPAPLDVQALINEAVARAVQAARVAPQDADAGNDAPPEDETDDERIARLTSAVVQKELAPLLEAQKAEKARIREAQFEQARAALRETMTASEIVKVEPSLSRAYNRGVNAEILMARASIAAAEGRERPLTADEVRSIGARVNADMMAAYAAGIQRARQSRPGSVPASVAAAQQPPAPVPASRPAPVVTRPAQAAEKTPAKPRVARSIAEITDPNALRERYAARLM